MKNVVIIGGGFCGVFCAKTLDYSTLNVTLIDPSECFENKPSIHKLLFTPKHKVEIPYSEIFRYVHHKEGRGKKITPQKVILETGEELPYDYLVIASGSVAPPAKGANASIFAVHTANDCRKISKALEKAQRIVIAGGGLTGIEVAGEIATKSCKHVTLVQRKKHLLDRMPHKSHGIAEQFLRKKKVTLIYEDTIKSVEGGYAMLRSGTKVPCDIMLSCIGIRPLLPTLYFTPTLDASFADTTNSHIFFGGDASPLVFEKNAKNALIQGKIIGRNILRLLDNKPLFPGYFDKRPTIISLGDTYGIFVYHSFVMGGCIPGLLKNVVEHVVNFEIMH